MANSTSFRLVNPNTGQILSSLTLNPRPPIGYRWSTISGGWLALGILNTGTAPLPQISVAATQPRADTNPNLTGYPPNYIYLAPPLSTDPSKPDPAKEVRAGPLVIPALNIGETARFYLDCFLPTNIAPGTSGYVHLVASLLVPELPPTG